ncbi:hypothetical protein AJ80_04491 [Polytolypa hystricis UAMH7299]|uniref:Pentacotripeptide-repeat region of PRORP domain-containing protein n=1 Tax=Polytolypa hystricis (strain UAMH7299) TaxID=1447883 RepID=A0A2B7YBA1_POLH7|nr:hypothetical protein AJ80_04491 [Polytolypa hystricis UAMH7299]
MLERAARSLENAGQRVFSHSKKAIRSEGVLNAAFWHHGAIDIELSSGYGKSQRRPSKSCSSSAKFRSAPVFSYPPDIHLEFLYPPRTKSFARAYLRNYLRGPVHRRSRRQSSRAYSSNPASDIALRQMSIDLRIPQLQALLDGTGSPELGYDTAWDLYQSCNCPQHLRPQLLAYMSESSSPKDIKRAETLFATIPTDHRRAENYLSVVKSLLRESSDTASVLDICKEAVARFQGQLCWSFTLSIVVDRADWDTALELWRNKPHAPPGHDPIKSECPDLYRLEALPKRLLSVLEKVETGVLSKRSPGLPSLSKFLMHIVVANKIIMQSTSTESLLLLFRRLSNLKWLEARHYLRAITTLEALDIKSAIIRSLVVYRNFRWVMSEVKPNERLLTGLLGVLCSLHVAEGVSYLLDEFRLFHGKPSVGAYKRALTTYSRLGDVTAVHQTFDNYLEDHGPPSDQKVLSPLIYVHARVGEFEMARQELERLSKAFNFVPDRVTWNILLTAHANANDHHGASRTLNEMIKAGASPSSYTIGILMSLLAKRRDLDGVLSMFTIAKRYKVRLNTAIFDTVVTTLCNNRRLAEAEDLVEHVLTLNLPGSVTRMFNILLLNYAFLLDFDAMVRLQNRMREAKVPFDGMTYAVLMMSLVRSQNTGPARDILELLHRNRRIRITELHYAILLIGYANSRNRDMIHVLYKEISERFKDIHPSSKLSILKAKIDRDLQIYAETGGSASGKELQLTHSEQYLDTIMNEFNIKAYATRQPQPGVRKRSVKEAFPAAYYDQIISTYGAHGALDRASQLFEEYRRMKQGLPTGGDSSGGLRLPLRLLDTVMQIHLKAKDYKMVERCWETAFERTLRVVRPFSVILTPNEPDEPSASFSTSGSTYTTNITQPASPQPVGSADDAHIIPSHRFVLSYCLNPFIKALAFQQDYSRIAEVISEVERAGFALTTHNWSLYIKLLCLSAEVEHQTLAFTLFEEKFISNFPGWKYLRRSYSLRPPGASDGLDLLESKSTLRGKHPGLMGKVGRSVWSNIDPSYMQPTYVTMIHLGSALIEFKARSVADGGESLRALYEVAPGTFDAVCDIPYLREKFQKSLLRGEDVWEEEEDDSGPTEIPVRDEVWTRGILGTVGGRRLKTQPFYPKDRNRNPIDEEGDPIDEEDDEKMDYYYKAITSEPDPDQLSALLEEDEAWKSSLQAQMRSDMPPPPEETLRPEDELDLAREAMNKSGESARELAFQKLLYKSRRQWPPPHSDPVKRRKRDVRESVFDFIDHI